MRAVRRERLSLATTLLHEESRRVCGAMIMGNVFHSVLWSSATVFGCKADVRPPLLDEGLQPFPHMYFLEERRRLACQVDELTKCRQVNKFM